MTAFSSIYWLLAAFVVTALLSTKSLYATEFPVFDDSYCFQLTAKMLDPEEKAVETEKCQQDEKVAKQQLDDHWSLVSDLGLKNCLRPAPKSYAFLRMCMAGDIGWQCFKDELACK